MAEHEPLIRDWLKHLAVVTTTTGTADELHIRIIALASMLVEKFPADAFTRASLEAVAAKTPFFPSYAELLGALSPWWREQRVARAILALPLPAESRERYQPPPAPDWCFNRGSRHLGFRQELTFRPPERSARQQISALGFTPAQVAAMATTQEVKRGPVIVAEDTP